MEFIIVLIMNLITYKKIEILYKTRTKYPLKKSINECKYSQTF